MDLTEIKQSSEKVYEGSIIDVERDVVSLPDGEVGYREIVRHPGGACVCAIDEEMNVYLVRQFRYAYGEELLELPAGKIDEGEDPAETARRELMEEAGVEADELILIGELYPSPGYADEIIYMYLTVNAKPAQKNTPDAGEFIKVEKMYIADAVQMAVQNDIKDGKTQLCLLKTYLILQNMEQMAEMEGQGMQEK